MKAWPNSQTIVMVLLSTCLISCEPDVSMASGQKGVGRPKCSNRFCIDLNCVPCSCPRMIKTKDSDANNLLNKFASLVSFLNANINYLSSSCNMSSAIQSMSTVTVCTPDYMAPSPETQPFDAAIIIQSFTQVRGPIPSGAIIYSSNLVVISGFFWNQVIFFYQGQYCYISYNTGIRSIASLTLTITNSVEVESIKKGLIPTKNRDLRKLETKMRQGGFGEGMVASDLTTILRCVPNAMQFNQVKCLSSEVLPTLLLDS